MISRTVCRRTHIERHASLRGHTIAHSSLKGHIETLKRRQDPVVVMGSERVVNSPDSAAITRRITNAWRLEAGSWRLLVRHANITP